MRGAPGEGEAGAPDDTTDPDTGAEGGVNKQVAEKRALLDRQSKDNTPDDADSGETKTPSAETSTA